jgi:hypothetical protein
VSYKVETISYKDFDQFIEVPMPSENDTAKFNLSIDGIKDTILLESGEELTGAITNNRQFFNEVVDPALQGYIDKLKDQSKVEAINNLAIFSHQVYQNYFGKGFYRWGGDIFDLDHPAGKRLAVR